MNLNILIPSRNNLDFLKLAYSSIRKNQGNHCVEILVLDDKSDKDNTWEWCEEIMDFDLDFKAFKNERKERLGISSGYKFLSQQATQEIICHWHADMVMTEGTLDAVERELFTRPEQYKSFEFCGSTPYSKNVVCLTRIEPPIYDKPGVYPEKIIWKEAPIELEDWNEPFFTANLPHLIQSWGGKKTGGHFAPFFMFREEYNRLGGNDIENFPKQAREDSDWGFRLVLAGFETIQIPHMVFHFASRGNRRSKHESGNFVDNPEWQEIDRKSTRNFIRKWGTFHPLHDEFLTPRKPKVYNIGFILQNPSFDLINALEPWCSRMICPTIGNELIDNYVRTEQPNTPFNLKEKLEYGGCETDIIVEIDGQRFNQSDYQTIQYLSQIIEESGEVGEFELGNLKITIKSLQTYEDQLIVCKNDPINLNDGK